jgi:hypothetical protein
MILGKGAMTDNLKSYARMLVFKDSGGRVIRKDASDEHPIVLGLWLIRPVCLSCWSALRSHCMSSIPLWTSTQFHNWKTVCAKCTASHQAFEVIDVNNPEQEAFCAELCGRHHYTCVIEKCVATCSPAISDEVLPGISPV